MTGREHQPGGRGGDSGAPVARILLVDDDVVLGKSMQRVLAHEGFACEVCNSVATAMQSLRAHPVDLVVTDILMPDHDGLELLRYLRTEVQPYPKVIAISGGSHGLEAPFLLKTANMMGAVTANLAKPFTADEFRAVVRSVLAQS